MNSLIEKIYAQVTNTPSIKVSESGINSISDLLTTIANWIIIVAGGLAFIYLLYSGILYITAAGNPDQAKKGQQGIINAIIGIIVIVLAYIIVQVVANTAYVS